MEEDTQITQNATGPRSAWQADSDGVSRDPMTVQALALQRYPPRRHLLMSRSQFRSLRHISVLICATTSCTSPAASPSSTLQPTPKSRARRHLPNLAVELPTSLVQWGGNLWQGKPENTESDESRGVEHADGQKKTTCCVPYEGT